MAYMLGNSVRPQGPEETTAIWHPVHHGKIVPMTACVQDRRGNVVAPEKLSGLTGVHYFLGETILESACHFLAKRISDPSYRIIGSACGVGGKRLSELLADAESLFFNRLVSCRTAVEEAAKTDGHLFQPGAILFLQGEADYMTHTPGATYQAQLQQLSADIQSHFFAPGIAPRIFTYQTSLREFKDVKALDVGEVQLQMALTTPGWVLAAPSYPVPDRGVHLDSNGYRWLGSQFGKVLWKELFNGQRWLPLHPSHIRREAQDILIEFHVPIPPLRWGTPFVGANPIVQKDRGFCLADELGEIPIADISIEQNVRVRLRPVRMMQGDVRLTYAGTSASQQGVGSLHDSDPTLADMCFVNVYSEEQSAGLTDYIDKPYPLWNWCVSFERVLAAS